jgi:hypothetical protein
MACRQRYRAAPVITRSERRGRNTDLCCELSGSERVITHELPSDSDIMPSWKAVTAEFE